MIPAAIAALVMIAVVILLVRDARRRSPPPDRVEDEFESRWKSEPPLVKRDPL